MTTQFTITPRYADKAGTIPMPSYRNVHDASGYIGQLCIHDGTWTPLYRTDDLDNPKVMQALQAAADQMNASV